MTKTTAQVPWWLSEGATAAQKCKGRRVPVAVITTCCGAYSAGGCDGVQAVILLSHQIDILLKSGLFVQDIFTDRYGEIK
ncbi:MAG: hypothetical protein ACRC0C_03375 [Gibbsiella quercinecans]|uniref:hypothetical protein n=1 Tax=Gibbsiella quercinecans TaxID=929813 RepID=UPI003F35F2DD